MKKEMSNKEKWGEARRMLSLYYEGTLSRAEIAGLRELLATSDPLPEDLATERQLLDMMSSAVEEMHHAVEVPAGLEATLRLNLHRQASAERAGGAMRHRRWWRWCGAAAVAVGVFVAYQMYEQGEKVEEPPTLTARTENEAAKAEAESETSIAQQLPNISPTAQRVYAYQYKSPAKTVPEENADKSEKSAVHPETEVAQQSSEYALALAIAEMREVSKDVFMGAKENFDEASIEAAVSLSDVRTAFLDDIYSIDNAESETIIEP